MLIISQIKHELNQVSLIFDELLIGLKGRHVLYTSSKAFLFESCLGTYFINHVYARSIYKLIGYAYFSFGIFSCYLSFSLKSLFDTWPFLNQ